MGVPSVPSRRTRTANYATARKQAPGSRRGLEAELREECEKPRESLYLAELFIVEQECGLGLGKLLLTATLHARNCVHALRRLGRLGRCAHLVPMVPTATGVRCWVGLPPAGQSARKGSGQRRNPRRSSTGLCTTSRKYSSRERFGPTKTILSPRGRGSPSPPASRW